MTVRPTLFVSYRRTQTSAVRPVVAALERAGIDCFFDQDDIDPLADFPERVRQGIDDSHALLVWWSADYGDSDHCLAELRRAWQHARRRSSDVGRRIWLLNPENAGHHVFAGELDAKNFLVPPAAADLDTWAQRLTSRLDALLAEGPLADERASLAPGVLRHVPTPNARFTGRGATLLRIHSKLFPPQIGVQADGAAVWLHGMGGLGKTEVAAKYAHDFAHAYPGGVFWLSFAGFEPSAPLDPAAAEIAAYRALEGAFAREPELQAKLLRDAEGKPLSWTQARAKVAAWLAQPGTDVAPPAYLWVLDNVPPMSPQDLRAQVLDGWTAPTPAGRTLLTTRDARVAAGFIEERLEELGEVDALRLLARFRPITPAERGQVEALAREVGRHTIALMLLGHRVAADGDYAKTLATLKTAGRLDRLEQIAGRLQKDLGAAARSVVATFELSIAPLDARACRLLALASVCAPNEAIPRDLLRAAFGGDDTGDDFADAVTALLSASLLSARRGHEAVDIHPLVADVAARLLGVTSEREGEEIAQALLPRIASADDIRTHAAIGDDIVHARHVAAGLESGSGVWLALRIGRFEAARGQYAAALQAEEAACVVSRRVLGDEHPDTLMSMNNLALTLRAQGDLNGARVLQEQALAVCRRVLGEEHPATLTSMNNLALTLSAQGDLAGARVLEEQVLAARCRVLGEEHPDTLTSMNNLASTLWAQGDLAGARVLQEEVLAVRCRVLGEEHPDTLTSMNNLASTLWAQGDLAGAKMLQEQALAVRRRVQGEEHPTTLTSMNNLAETLRAQGDLAGARALQDQALAVRRRVLGEEHPATLTAMNNLAGTLGNQGDLAGARALQEQVLAARRRLLGEEHPDTLTSMNNLAETLRDQGDLAGARALHEQVLAVHRRVLGEEHPDTLGSMTYLAGTLWVQGDLAGARALQEQVLAARLWVLGEEHPATEDAAFGLLVISHQQGDKEQVRKLIEVSPPRLAARLKAWLAEQTEVAATAAR